MHWAVALLPLDLQAHFLGYQQRWGTDNSHVVELRDFTKLLYLLFHSLSVLCFQKTGKIFFDLCLYDLIHRLEPLAWMSALLETFLAIELKTPLLCTPCHAMR